MNSARGRRSSDRNRRSSVTREWEPAAKREKRHEDYQNPADDDRQQSGASAPAIIVCHIDLQFDP